MVVGFSVCKAEAPRNFLRQLSYKVRGSSRSVEGRRSSAIQVSAGAHGYLLVLGLFISQLIVV